MLVKIDRTTIKKNPNAGKTTYILPIGPEECFKTEYYGDRVKEYVVYSKSERLILDRPRREGDLQSGSISCRYSQPTQVIHTLSPEPAYFYKYENPTIECEYCKSQFKHTELQSDEYSFCEDYGYSDCVCPKCKEWNCCKLEYENIEDAIKRND